MDWLLQLRQFSVKLAFVSSNAQFLFFHYFISVVLILMSCIITLYYVILILCKLFRFRLLVTL